MMRAKPASSMQKTYDDCYLICSTAVYFEGQNNEAEALRSWRNALDQIYYHNAYRIPSGYRPKSETERALQESLRQMELQCKERVDLLEALRESRDEAKSGSTGDLSTRAQASNTSLPIPPDTTETARTSSLGGGSVPTLDYHDIARVPAPALPARPRAAQKRPSYTSKKSSNGEIPRNGRDSPQLPSSSTFLSPNVAAVGPNVVDPNRKGSRTPSPEKKGGMLRTLRAGGKERSGSGKLATTMRSRPAASKAATQAWTSTITPRTSMSSADQASTETNGTSATTWDPYTRSLVDRPPSRDAPTLIRNSSEASVRPASPLTSPPMFSPPTFSPPTFSPPTTSDAHFGSANRSTSYPPPYPDFPPSHTAPNPPPHKMPSSRDFDNRAAEAPATHPSYGDHLSSQNSQSTFSGQSSSTVRPSSPQRIHRSEVTMPAYRKEYLPPQPSKYKKPPNAAPPRIVERPLAPDPIRVASRTSPPTTRSTRAGLPPPIPRKAIGIVASTLERQRLDDGPDSHMNSGEENSSGGFDVTPKRRKQKPREPVAVGSKPKSLPSPEDTDSDPADTSGSPDQAWETRVVHLLKNLPKGVDEAAAKQILNEIVIQGDEVHWDDVAGLEIAKSALKETVVYPFLRPDLFMGLREPARGMLLFGPPGTGKTMLARAVATESRSTFFAISASSLTSKYLGESEKLVRALFQIAKLLAPSIIFVDEIDSLLGSRGGSSEHEATRRIKTEFLIQWSDLAKAAAGRETSDKDKEKGDAMRVLVLAATNLPWAIDEAARRRFVRRQYIPLPEDHVRRLQLGTLLSHQKHSLSARELDMLVVLTDGFSGSDITALAKDAAMGPLRSLGEKLLHMSPEDIRPIQYSDFQASLVNIRPSVSKAGLKEFDDWARDFGERGG